MNRLCDSNPAQMTSWRKALEQEFRRLSSRIGPDEQEGYLIRCEFACSVGDPLRWLVRQDVQGPWVYWRDREGTWESAAFGCCHIVEDSPGGDAAKVLQQIRRGLQGRHPRLRYYGGTAFHPWPTNGPWAIFGACRFLLPRFEMVRREDGVTVLAVNAFLKELGPGQIAVLLKELDQMGFSEGDASVALPAWQTRRDAPDRKEWGGIFRQVMSEIRAGDYQKLVLARQTTLGFPRPLDPVEVLIHLRKATPGCFHFGFHFGGDASFLGASPERLFLRKADGLFSEAVAGTALWPGGVLSGRVEPQDLLRSDKDLLEHRYVVDSIQSVLHPLCQTLTHRPVPRLLSIPSGQHLMTSFEARLKAGTHDGLLLRALHPTPAVGGVPMDRACARIQELEPFDRGWYAAPVGYVGEDQTEFAVAIRSGLLHGETLSLFAGAGLVHASDEEREWQEIEQKTMAFAGIFPPTNQTK